MLRFCLNHPFQKLNCTCNSIRRLPAWLPPPPTKPKQPASESDSPTNGERRFPTGTPGLVWLKRFRICAVNLRLYFFSSSAPPRCPPPPPKGLLMPPRCPPPPPPWPGAGFFSPPPKPNSFVARKFTTKLSGPLP